MKYDEIERMSLVYSRSGDHEKKLILQKVWEIEGATGLAILSRILDYPYFYLYIKGDIEAFRVRRNRKRRGRAYYGETKKNKIDELSIAEVAREAALGGIELNCGGKKTGHVCSNGSIKSISFAQGMQALSGQ
ncbi:hypothetical protein DCCM_3084 [Desulfocucumis palustris]|uniref:Uncharacterized protein n=1 Tax=Desulfocucumis palustris TaxID=1898651 RepID=A0A2L2XE35_9FIRM|nr:hypothetical protein [Desulfocucumis palustris]GBF33973.1 hypothetical protein DCCM_3084 [Desulfocucumis palustris]